MQLAYDEMDLVTTGDEIEHGAETIRSIVLLEGSRKPGAAIRATDLRPPRVDRAAALRSSLQVLMKTLLKTLMKILMKTGPLAKLRELVDA